MTITSETFYRAECDHNGCEVTLPDDENDEGTHWPRTSVVEALGEERGLFDEKWTVEGEQTFCPRHKPGNADCTACDNGYLRTEIANRQEGQARFDFALCPMCGGRGYLSADVDGRDHATT